MGRSAPGWTSWLAGPQAACLRVTWQPSVLRERGYAARCAKSYAFPVSGYQSLRREAQPRGVVCRVSSPAKRSIAAHRAAQPPQTTPDRRQPACVWHAGSLRSDRSDAQCSDHKCLLVCVNISGETCLKGTNSIASGASRRLCTNQKRCP